MPNSRLASPSATINVLKRHGLYTKKSLGQHFLIDDNVVGRIIDTARIEPGEAVIEVGPGIGTLTAALLGASANVVAVEYDPRLLPALGEVRGERDSLAVVHADAVSVPVDSLTAPFGPPRALVANLPYAVAATVVLRFFEEIPTLERAVVMVQAEVAERMAAVPGTKAYGAYTVKLGLRAAAGARFGVPRSCFMPPPRVDSAVIRLDRSDRGLSPSLVAAASRAADAAFSQRRKTVRNALGAGLGITQGDTASLLEDAGVDGSLRAENLGVDTYVALGRSLEQRGL